MEARTNSCALARSMPQISLTMPAVFRNLLSSAINLARPRAVLSARIRYLFLEITKESGNRRASPIWLTSPQMQRETGFLPIRAQPQIQHYFHRPETASLLALLTSVK